MSSTLLPSWFLVAAGVATLSWAGVEGSASENRRRPLPFFRAAILAIWWLALVLEVPFHVTPRPKFLGHPPIHIVGDSLTAGIDEPGTAT